MNEEMMIAVDETIRISIDEYDELKDLSTRVDVLVGMMKKHSYLSDEDILGILGYSNKCNEEKEEENEDNEDY